MKNVLSLADIEPQVVPLAEGHHNGRIWWIFNKDTVGTEGLRMHVQEYSPGGYTQGHAPHQDFEQAYYVIAGTMAVKVSGKEYVAQAGSFVYIPRGAEHSHYNAGTDNLVFLTINAPVRSGQAPPLPEGR